MSARITMTGFDELIQTLTDAPQDIRTEAMGIIREETEGAAVEMSQRFGFKTGKLRRSVKTSYPSSTILLGLAQATAPHAHLNAFGTQDRKNRAGANRGHGEPLNPGIVEIGKRRRARMFRRFRELLVRRGFQVGE